MKSNVKKIVSCILSLCLLLSCAAPAVSAREQGYVPSIVIPGVFQSDVNLYDRNGLLALNSDGEEFEKPFYLDTTKEIVLNAVKNALLPISKLLLTQQDKDKKAALALADVLGDVVMKKVLGRDGNGNMLFDVHATKYGSFASCSPKDQEYIFDQIPLSQYVDVAGGENLYFFSYFSFDSIKGLAEELYQYIQTVKKETGSAKVNIVPISQGGTLANALLALHPEVKNDLNRIVFIVPALDGTDLLGDLFANGFLSSDDALYSYMLPTLLDDDDQLYLGYLINIVLRIMPNADLKVILDTVVDTLVDKYIKYSTCMWALASSEYYPKAAEKFLSGEENKALREETDWYYNQAQLKSDENIQACVNAGIKVFDICDYNAPLYPIVNSWSASNADGVIQLDSTSMGATSFGVNVELPEGYVSQNSKCKNPAHNHIDPWHLVDASTGLLPENTFYFYNQNHERTADNDVIISLAVKLLTDESFVDIYSYPEQYPQFNMGRRTKSIRRSIKHAEEMDVSAVSPELQQKLADALAQARADLSVTVVTQENLQALKNDEAALDAVINEIGNIQLDEKEIMKEQLKEKALAVLAKVLKWLSDILYRTFGGKGFSEIFSDLLNKFVSKS